MAPEITTPNNNHGKRGLFQNVKYQYLAVIIGECFVDQCAYFYLLEVKC